MSGPPPAGGDPDPGLPLDGDVEVAFPPRPVHLRARYLALTAAGGALGTAARVGVAALVPPVAGLPAGTLVVNVVGAFVLGLLLEALARRGADEGARRAARLLLGTGFCGGFTTYSTFATDTAQLAGRPGAALLVLAVTLVVGAAATAAGVVVGAGRRR